MRIKIHKTYCTQADLTFSRWNMLSPFRELRTMKPELDRLLAIGDPLNMRVALYEHQTVSSIDSVTPDETSISLKIISDWDDIFQYVIADRVLEDSNKMSRSYSSDRVSMFNIERL